MFFKNDNKIAKIFTISILLIGIINLIIIPISVKAEFNAETVFNQLLAEHYEEIWPLINPGTGYMPPENIISIIKTIAPNLLPPEIQLILQIIRNLKPLTPSEQFMENINTPQEINVPKFEPYVWEVGIPGLVKKDESMPFERGISPLVKILIWWAFSIAGILAFAMIVYAGFQYLTSGGNTSQQKDAQERIVSAIIGIILLFAFWIILNTINPDILSGASDTTTLPSSEAISEEAKTEEEEKPQQIGDFVLIGASATLDNYNSIPLSSEFVNGAYIDKETADKLVILAEKQGLGNWTVTEACTEISNNKCITTIDHLSACHSLGTCVDVGYGGNPGDSIRTAFIQAANAAGFDVIDEYSQAWQNSNKPGSGFHLEPTMNLCDEFEPNEAYFCISEL